RRAGWDCRSSKRAHYTRATSGSLVGALNHDVVPRDSHINRQAAARVEDDCGLPVAQERVAQAAQIERLALADRKRVHGADIEGLADVEVVIALFRRVVVAVAAAVVAAQRLRGRACIVRTAA